MTSDMPLTPLAEDDYDPFAAFDAAMGADAVRDPYPGFAELLARGPVLAGDLDVLLGYPPSPLAEFRPPDAPPSYVALSHDAVQTVLRDGETFSSAGYQDTIGLVMGNSILGMDEPDHHAYRGLVQQAFTRKAMERWRVEVVEPIVHTHIDTFAERGSADLVRELTFPFPVAVIARMLGLPDADVPWFHRRAVELIGLTADIERGFAASRALHDYFLNLVTQRRTDPRDDVISVLAAAELDGQRLTDEEIIAFLRLLLPAGAETTYRSSSNLLFGLLSNPDQLTSLRHDRALLPAAIEEGLRWEPPLTGIARTCTRDTVVAGVGIPAGASVFVCIGAANRDPARYERPHAFDIHRPPQQHMAFAFGPHMCLGMHLARMETSVVIEALLDRVHALRLDPAAENVHVAGLVFRAPRSLPVVFDT